MQKITKSTRYVVIGADDRFLIWKDGDYMTPSHPCVAAALDAIRNDANGHPAEAFYLRRITDASSVVRLPLGGAA